MTENKKEQPELTPWQKQHLEYQAKKKAEEAAAAKTAKKDEKKSGLFGRKKSEEEDPETEEEPAKDELLEPSGEKEQEPEGDFSESDFFESIDEEDDESEDELEPYWDRIKPVLKKLWIALAVVAVVFLGSIYAISPLSKIGGFSVSGNNSESSAAIATSSGLKTGDSIFKILSEKGSIQNKIAGQFPRVATVALKFHFPNRFEAVVKEYQAAVYVQQSGKNYLVLDNGYIVKNQPVDKPQAGLPILANFSDEQAQTFVKAMESFKPDLQKLIGNATKTPTTATQDFIQIDMKDGNQVRVPLSQMSVKMPYYTSVAKQLTPPQVVDMEAGIYAKSPDAYAADLSSISVSKSESAQSVADSKAAAAEVKAAAQDNTAQSSTTEQGN